MSPRNKLLRGTYNVRDLPPFGGNFQLETTHEWMVRTLLEARERNTLGGV